jgi:hypothetical protein
MPEFYHEQYRKSAKDRKCYNCREVIQRGERYLNVTGKWDYGVASLHLCECCDEVKQLLDKARSCYTFENLEDAYNELWANAPKITR